MRATRILNRRWQLVRTVVRRCRWWLSYGLGVGSGLSSALNAPGLHAVKTTIVKGTDGETSRVGVVLRRSSALFESMSDPQDHCVFPVATHEHQAHRQAFRITDGNA